MVANIRLSDNIDSCDGDEIVKVLGMSVVIQLTSSGVID